MDNNIEEAAKILMQGGIIIFPTDTVYGIGCRIDNEKAIKKLFAIRKRPPEKAVPVLVENITQAADYFQTIPSRVRKIMSKYWPGPLTIVYKSKNEKIPKLVRGGGNTIGLRMPDSKIALSLIKQLGVPLLGPSANFHNNPTPKNYSDLDPRLIKLVDYVVKGDVKLGISSTVLDCTQKPFKIIRQGGLFLDEKDFNY